MNRPVGFVQKCVLSALLSSMVWAVPGMQARAEDPDELVAPEKAGDTGKGGNSVKNGSDDSLLPGSDKSGKGGSDDSLLPGSEKSGKGGSDDSLLLGSDKSGKGGTDESLLLGSAKSGKGHARPQRGQPNVVKAPAAVEPVPFWWFHGTVEAGGRFFLNDPPRNGSAYLRQQSLAKFYEYRDLRPGPFANVWLATGSRDGLYEVDVGGKNVGYDDQSYYLGASKAGEQYFNFGWDQTPHLYSTSAQTFYQGLGSSALTLPPGLCCTTIGGIAGFGNVNFNSGLAPIALEPFLYQTDIGIKRDTAAAAYRWTPTDAWDIRADYSHLSRTGTQVDGIVGFGRIASGASSPVQVPKPVDEATQNFGLNGEYAGTSPWGKKFTIKLAYYGSVYDDKLSSYTVQNPYTNNSPPPASLNFTAGQSPFARLSTWPSNNMNGFSGAVGADLPWKSRYTGTLNYTMMRQDDAFIPMSFQNPTFPPPTSSLNGAVNTLLSNNFVNTQITPDLRSKLSYRYYNFDNNTPQLLFPSWISLDQTAANETAIRALVLSYNKQNAGEELVWRPTRAWTLGATYGFERYNWTNYVAAATNENSGKVFANWEPTSWFTLRSSGYYSDRRADNYDLANFTNFQFPGTAATNLFKFSPAYQMLMVDNRERWKANVAFDMVVIPRVTVTPNFKYQDDHYGLNPANQLGLTDARSWDGGIDLTYIINPRTSMTVGYLREYLTQLVYNTTQISPTALPGGANFAETNDRIVVDTFTGLLRYAVIPDKLDTELRYTASHGVDNQRLLFATGATPIGGQFPDVKTWYQRLDAVATYTFDQAQVTALGWKGEVKAKLRYAWERNSVNNWQQDPLTPFGNTGEPQVVYLAYDNPNYNVHMLAASLAFTW
jgi:MtrB/PioB family decaheme-associated outer membrane protein